MTATQGELLQCRSDARLDLESVSPALYLVHAGDWHLQGPDEECLLRAGQIALVPQRRPHRLIHKPSEPAGPVGSSHAATVVRFADPELQVDRLDSLPWVVVSQVGAPQQSGPPLSTAEQVMTNLARQVAWMVLQSADGQHHGKRLDDDIVQAIREMESHPDKDWTVERLAEQVQMSRSAFAQKFREQVGLPPTQFLLETRMKLAAGLLEEKRHHLKEIARRAGYRSVSAFSTAFKRWCALSPSEYRKQ